VRSSDEPAVVAKAVDELPRYLTITHRGRRRVATADIEVAGSLFQRIPPLALAKPIAELSFKHDMTVYGLHDLPVTWQT
jgi:hypothetical protein